MSAITASVPVARTAVVAKASARSAKASVSGMGASFSGLKAVPACFGPKAAGFAAVKASVKTSRRSASALQTTSALGPMEIMQLAGTMEDEVFRTAGTMYAITLVGLAVGFVLLRVEAFSNADE